MPRFNPNNYDPSTDSSPGTEGLRALGLTGVILTLDPGTCLCGCGEIPRGKKSLFAMGHDARLKGKLIRAHVTGNPVHTATVEGGAHQHDETMPAIEFAEQLGWEEYLHAAEDRGTRRLSDRLADANRGVLARALATREREETEGLQPGDRRLIKVGRWEYTGQVLAVYQADGEAELEYVTKKGETKTVRKPLEEVDA